MMREGTEMTEADMIVLGICVDGFWVRLSVREKSISIFPNRKKVLREKSSKSKNDAKPCKLKKRLFFFILVPPLLKVELKKSICSFFSYANSASKLKKILFGFIWLHLY
jgi:hypothetical protein